MSSEFVDNRQATVEFNELSMEYDNAPPTGEAEAVNFPASELNSAIGGTDRTLSKFEKSLFALVSGYA